MALEINLLYMYDLEERPEKPSQSKKSPFKSENSRGDWFFLCNNFFIIPREVALYESYEFERGFVRFGIDESYFVQYNCTMYGFPRSYVPIIIIIKKARGPWDSGSKWGSKKAE